jgi:hypothetical protein
MSEKIIEIKAKTEALEIINKEWPNADVQSFLQGIADLVINGLVEVSQFTKVDRDWSLNESFRKYCESASADLTRRFITKTEKKE